jgi:sulfate/thiosulfate transport system substrate-binding protein
MRTTRFRTSWRVLAPLLAAVLVVVTACSGAASGKQVSVVAYSVPKPAYDALTAAFEKTSAGKKVSFKASYGASGDQSRAVLAGQPADYVTFSIEPDMTKLVPKFVDASWASGPTHGLVSESVVVLVVRKGNPKNIDGWDDLTKPGIKIVTPDPGSSGSAKWNILGAYTHVLKEGGTEAQAQAYLKQFFGHVVAKPESGSKATQTFLNGTGDVLLSYENEAIQSRAKGLPVDYVVPAESMLIENPAAVTTKAPKAAKDFLAFVQSKAGQTIFASKGYRSVITGIDPGDVAGANDPTNPFPDVAKLATIQDLGGWKVVNKKYFDPTTGIVTKIEGSSG